MLTVAGGGGAADGRLRADTPAIATVEDALAGAEDLAECRPAAGFPAVRVAVAVAAAEL